MILSLVTARIVRENENCKYRLVGKGEKYIVRHESDKRPEDIVSKFLKPYAVEPVTIESVLKMKKPRLIESEGEWIYRVVLKFLIESDNGKMTKKTEIVYVSSSGFIADVCKLVMEDYQGCMADFSIVSVTRTNIIEIL